ncbi:MAG TPA: bifunctional phosphoglucose/phosphomannose isomerase [Thermoplasmata archaeon]
MLDPEEVARIDPEGMRDIIASLPDQLEASLRFAPEASYDVGDAQRVFVVGMGGSAIAGDVFAAWVADRAKVPIQVVRDYRLPSYARPEDLLIAVSYSGNTEETLNAAAQGMKLGCRMAAVTSGGSLRDLARRNGVPVFEVPTGLPPRGAFGHLFGVLPAIGEGWVVGPLRAELERTIAHLRKIRKRLRPEAGVRSNGAKRLAIRLRGTVPIIYATTPFTPIAKRWQTQLNENAKVLAFSSSLPEADHNELVGWSEDARARRHTPILLRDRDEPPEVRRQLDITVDLMSRRASAIEVDAEGESLLSRLLGTLYLGDYVSLYLATLRRVDPTPVPPIAELKRRLARGRRKN